MAGPISQLPPQESQDCSANCAVFISSLPRPPCQLHLFVLRLCCSPPRNPSSSVRTHSKARHGTAQPRLAATEVYDCAGCLNSRRMNTLQQNHHPSSPSPKFRINAAQVAQHSTQQQYGNSTAHQSSFGHDIPVIDKGTMNRAT